MEVAKILNSYKDKIIAIRGNCDAQVDETISEFKFQDFEEILINDLEFFFTHGHIYNSSNIPRFSDVIVHGHTHVGMIEEIEGKIFLNPGSISIPRNNTNHSYATIDDKEMILKDISGEELKKRSLNN